LVLPPAEEPVAVGKPGEVFAPFPELPPPAAAVVCVSLPDPASFTFAAEIVYTTPSPPLVYVNTAPLAGVVTVPARFDNVAVPLAGRLSGP
jgi:hypothetical protein